MHYRFKCGECDSLYFSTESSTEFHEQTCEFCLKGEVRFMAMSIGPFPEQTMCGKSSKYDDVMIMYGAAGITGSCKGFKHGKKNKADVKKVNKVKK